MTSGDLEGEIRSNEISSSLDPGYSTTYYCNRARDSRMRHSNPLRRWKTNGKYLPTSVVFSRVFTSVPRSTLSSAPVDWMACRIMYGIANTPSCYTVRSQTQSARHVIWTKIRTTRQSRCAASRQGTYKATASARPHIYP